MKKTLKMKITDLPHGTPTPPLDLPHFPTRFQAVIWRNWNLVSSARLAKVLSTNVETITREAERMGLPSGQFDPEQLWLRRGYITLIRQNWHLLPYFQLLELLGWTPEQMDYALREDDFLWNKLGKFKPETRPVGIEPLNAEQKARTEILKELTVKHFGSSVVPPACRPFDFLRDLNSLPVNWKYNAPAGAFGMRLAYSYSAVYGDPLLDPELDPYPEGLLARLSANGINAIWLQGVLYTLVPWLGKNHFSKGHEKRIANLSALTAKAAKYGIGVYLYMNEPRAMPAEIFAEHPEWMGAKYSKGSYSDKVCLCIFNGEVLEKFRGAVAELFRRAPELAGIFTITMSENLTHCQSHHGRPGIMECPLCSQKTPPDLVAAVNNVIAEAVHSVKPEADVIVWDWAWDPKWASHAIEQLRPDIKLMCSSEAFLVTDAMGVKGYVADYSMSKVGPGPLAESNWRVARQCGLETLAKVQINNTWECSAVPYLPVPFLVKKHLRELEKRQVSGLMVSWTLGGYPGGNLRLLDKEPEELAVELFGEQAAPGIISAWRSFSDAFTEFPLHGCPCLYTGPQNYGPMNLLFPNASGYKSTMLGFPYDDLTKWRGNHFPDAVFEEQFRKVSEGWGDGLDALKKTAPLVPADRKAHIDDLLNVAEAAYCHFRSTYLQIRFIRLRDDSDKTVFTHDRNSILDEEISLARKLLAIVRRDSRIGFEASNHYYYTENSLKEKILNCEYLKTIQFQYLK